jgi:SAM-dependent methyltransferase
MSAIYEDPAVLAEYLLFHYGSAEEILTPETSWPAGMVDAIGFAVRTASRFSDSQAERGLDLGCAVGRSTFEMSRICGHVTGIDFSHAFIGAANRLRDGHPVPYERLDEAHRSTALAATIPSGVDPGKSTFLARLPDLVNPGGELVLATPCTWLEGFTAPEKWPPGDTLGWLKDHLGNSFEFTDCGDEPFLIRETARKFQWTRSMLSVWRKR